MIIVKYFSRIGIALSVLLNVFLGGPSNQTFSARNWEWKRQNKPNLVCVIDLICNIIQYALKIVLPNYYIDLSMHCMHSWVYWHARKDIT